MSLDVVVFFVSAIVAVFGATMVIIQRNTVASVLYLIVSLVAQAVLYVQLGSLFMGAVLIIVYAGAIMVLFLFVIMLLNLRGREDLADHSPPVSRFTKYLVSVLLFIEMWFIVKSGFFPNTVGGGIMAEQQGTFGSVEDIATILFTRYLYPFELTSVLIMAAIVGAVVMAKRDRSDSSPSVRTRGDKPARTTGDEAGN